MIDAIPHKRKDTRQIREDTSHTGQDTRHNKNDQSRKTKDTRPKIKVTRQHRCEKIHDMTHKTICATQYVEHIMCNTIKDIIFPLQYLPKMNSESVDSGDETEDFHEERYLQEIDKHLQVNAARAANKAHKRNHISRSIQPRSNAHSNGALNHTEPMQQLHHNSAQTRTVISTIVLTLFVVVFILKATCECTCTIHI